MKTIQMSLFVGLAAVCGCTSTSNSYRIDASPGAALPRAGEPRPHEPSPQEPGAQQPSAQEQSAKPSGDKVTLPVGVGFTSGPSSHMLAAALDFPVAENWSIGPSLEFGVTDDRTLVTALFQAKRYFPLSSGKEGVRRLLPYALGGVGAAYLEEDVGPNNVDGTKLVLAVGGGVRYSFSDRVTVGSQLQFNFLPSELLDERFYTSWEVAQFVFTF